MSMTENKQALPGHETQSDEMNCPNCGRFVGAITKCPYCGSKVEKRMSLVAVRWAAVLLATIGLFLLYMMAKHRDIPVVLLGDIKPTMNFGQIRVVGQVDSDARAFKSGGMGFNVSDGTGTIMVFVSQKQAKELGEKNLVPQAGDSISFAGGLNISDEEASMRLLSVRDLQLTRAPAASVRLADINDSLVGSSISIAGKVVELLPPPADSKRPYSLKVQDDSGEQTLNFWQAEYDQIQGKDVLNGAFIRARVSVASYKDKLQLKLSSGADIEILDGPPAAAPASLNPAKKAAAAYQAEKAAAAPRDFSRGRSVPAGSLSVNAVTAAQAGQTIRVRGRVESVSAPKEGTKQPFAVVLQEGEASLRVTYWSNVNEVISIKPTPGALFEFEGLVEVYKDKPQLKVASGFKVKLVDDMPASAPAVDVSQAVAVSSIALADKGQTRTVQGTLGAGRSLKSGVAYPLTDAGGTIDLILWESIIPVEILGQLEEGVKVAATGLVSEYEGKLQLKAAAGYSVMVIP
jgi:DNA/RNA endonuclease YhcR with UshA esterase domain